MGNLPASESSRRQKQDTKARAVERHNLLRCVERFAINVYATCPRIESMNLILTSDLAKNAFTTFVKLEYAEQNIELWQSIWDLKHSKSNKTISSYNMTRELERIIGRHIISGVEKYVNVKEELRIKLTNFKTLMDPDSESYLDEIDILFNEILRNTVAIMAKEQFNRFILSKQYKNWRAQNSSHALALTAEDANSGKKHSSFSQSLRSDGENDKEEKSKDNKRLSPINSVTVSSSSAHSKLQKASSSRTMSSVSVAALLRRLRPRREELSAFDNADNTEMGRLLGQESWLAALLAAVEALPISFLLSSARNDHRGFPLMYCNRYFENLTGYDRNFVLGKKW